MSRIVISGTGLYTPRERISNEELVQAFNTFVENYNHEHAAQIQAGKMEPLRESSAEFILKASGIKRRYVMEKSGILDTECMRPRLESRPNEEHSLQVEMAIAAATQALENARRTAAEVDAILVACSNMQRPYPAVSIELQSALGAGGFAFDLNVACSSATFGIQTAADALENGSAKRVLVVNPEICSAHLNFRDRDSHFIFGDACTAILLEREEDCRSDDSFSVLGTRLRTQFSNHIRNNAGFLNRAEDSIIREGPHTDKLFVQEGRKVFKEVVPLVVGLINEHLGDLGIAPASVKKMWLHQANLAMNQLISARLLGREASFDEAPVILDEYANTSSAGSIIAFHKHHSDMQSGDIGLICSFGAGYSVGNVVVRKR